LSPPGVSSRPSLAAAGGAPGSGRAPEAGPEVFRRLDLFGGQDLGQLSLHLVLEIVKLLFLLGGELEFATQRRGNQLAQLETGRASLAILAIFPVLPARRLRGGAGDHENRGHHKGRQAESETIHVGFSQETRSTCAGFQARLHATS